MLFSKLKITLCVAALALMAIVYRGFAQETKQAGSTNSAVGQPATEDLKALRLEVKALRLETEALRKALEGMQNQQPPRHENTKIVIANPQVKDVVISQLYRCEIRAHHHINVRAAVTGQIKEVLVKEGQAVKQGDVIFKIDPTPFQAKYDVQMAELKIVEIEFNNTKRLFDQKVVSSLEVSLFQAKLEKALAKAKVAAAELAFTRVKAPFDGVISRFHEQQGSQVKEGDVVTTLSDNKTLWVYFNVPEADYFEYILAKDRDKESPRIELVLANGSKFSKIGKIGAIEAKFNNDTSLIPFRADFENPNGLLRHGQTGNVLMSRTLKNATVIPQRATFEILGKRYVFVVDKAGVAHQREVNIQNELDDVFVIHNGLDANDNIVVEGVRQVRDGEKVKHELRKPGRR